MFLTAGEPVPRTRSLLSLPHPMLSLTALVLCSALITEDERPAPLRYNSTQFAHPAHRRTWPNWEPEALGAYGSVFDARQRKVVPARRAPPAFPAVWSARVAVERTVNGRLTSNETWHRWVDGDGSRLRADLLNSPNGTRTLLQFFAGHAAAPSRAGRTYVLDRTGACAFWCPFIDPLFFVPGARLHTAFDCTHRRQAGDGDAAAGAERLCDAEESLCAPLYTRDAWLSNATHTLPHPVGGGGGSAAYEEWAWVEGGFSEARDELRMYRAASNAAPAAGGPGAPRRLVRDVLATGFGTEGRAVMDFSAFSTDASAVANQFPADALLDKCTEGSVVRCPTLAQRIARSFEGVGMYYAFVNPLEGGVRKDV